MGDLLQHSLTDTLEGHLGSPTVLKGDTALAFLKDRLNFFLVIGALELSSWVTDALVLASCRFKMLCLLGI